MSTSKFRMIKNCLSTKVGIFELSLDRSSSSIIRYRQLIFIFFVKRAMAIFHNFLYFGCHFRIRRRQRSSIVHRSFTRWSCIFWYTIYKHCKWIMLIDPTFINESGHIKTLKIITRTVDFWIPTIKIFLNKKIFWRRLGIMGFFHNLHNNI